MSRTTPILRLALASLAVVVSGADRVAATAGSAVPAVVDCSDAGEPVEYDDPTVLVGEAPVAWLTLDDGGPSMVTYDLAAGAGQFVFDATPEFGASADLVITHEGEPFVDVTGLPAGRQCLVDVTFTTGRYEWRVAGAELEGTFGVPHRLDCEAAQPTDPWAAGSGAPVIVVDVGDDEIGVATGQALVAGTSTIAVHAVDGASADSLVEIERDRDEFAFFEGVPPGGVCSLDVDLPPGDYEVTSDLMGEPVTFTVWPFAVLDLSSLPGGVDPLSLGLDEARAETYTDACDAFSLDLVVAAIPAEVEAAAATASEPAASADPWQVTCEWSVDASDDLVVALTLPGLSGDGTFDEQRAEHAAEPGFTDLSVLADRCYATVSGDTATARCPYGPSHVMVSVAGIDGTDLVGAATTLLDNLWNRPAN